MILFHYQDILFLNLYILLECLFYQYHKNGSLIGSRPIWTDFNFDELSYVGYIYLTSINQNTLINFMYIRNGSLYPTGVEIKYTNNVNGLPVRSFEL